MTVRRSSGRSRARPLVRVLASIGLLTALSGCAAVVALPLVAGGVLYTRDKVEVAAATPVPNTATAIRQRGTAGAADSVILTDLRELPPPSSPAGPVAINDGWSRFFDFAARSASRKPDGQAQSALLASADSLKVERRACTSSYPAVIIDLDDGRTSFAPQTVGRAPSQLTEGLARLREAGVTILWITSLPASEAGRVAAALRASGLDPERRDQLLLVRNGEDRKQVLRQDANRDVCVMAIAGDRRADFDELFDYLRDPNAAVGLSSMLGEGWFLVPTPLGSGEVETP